MTRYRTIVADPPWDYHRDRGWHGYNGVPRYQVHPRYTLMSLEEMAAMAPMLERMADPAGCALFMWATAAFLHDAYHLLDAWGWPTPKAVWVWVKSENGRGMGRWCRNDAEYVLHAVRGDIPPPKVPESNVLRGPTGRHSEKPASFYDRVERVSPGPYLDLFGGRNTLRFGWDVWGDGK